MTNVLTRATRAVMALVFTALIAGPAFAASEFNVQSGTSAALPAGTNTLGNVGIVAGTAAIGSVTLASASNQIGSVLGGIYNTALPTLTNASTSILQTDSSGRVLVGSIAGALPAGAATIGNVGLIAGNSAIGTVSITSALPGGTNSLGYVTLQASSSTIGNVGIVAGAASIGTVGLNTGTSKIGTVSIDVLPSLPAGSAIAGKFGIDQTTPGTTNAIVLTAAATGGATPFFNDAVAGTVVQLKATAGQLYMLNAFNTTGATAYLQIFGKPSASVTLGTTVADWTIRLPLNSSSSVPLVFTVPVNIIGGSGLSIAGTTTATGLTGAAISVSALYQ